MNPQRKSSDKLKRPTNGKRESGENRQKSSDNRQKSNENPRKRKANEDIEVKDVNKSAGVKKVYSGKRMFSSLRRSVISLER